MGAGNQLAYFGTTEIDTHSVPLPADTLPIFDSILRRVKSITVADLFGAPLPGTLPTKDILPQLDLTYSIGASVLSYLRGHLGQLNLRRTSVNKRYYFAQAYAPSAYSSMKYKTSTTSVDISTSPASWGGTEILTADYNALSAEEDLDYVSVAVPSSYYCGALFKFNIDESVSGTDLLKIYWRGFHSGGVSHSVYVWDSINSVWVSIGSSTSSSPFTINPSITDVADYIDSGVVYFLVRTTATDSVLGYLRTNFACLETLPNTEVVLDEDTFNGSLNIEDHSTNAFSVGSAFLAALFKVNTFDRIVSVNGRFLLPLETVAGFMKTDAAGLVSSGNSIAASDVTGLEEDFLKLDFSNLETSATDGFVQNGNTLELWWNGSVVQSWTITPTTPAAGSFMGFGLITYA